MWFAGRGDFALTGVRNREATAGRPIDRWRVVVLLRSFSRYRSIRMTLPDMSALVLHAK